MNKRKRTKNISRVYSIDTNLLKRKLHTWQIAFEDWRIPSFARFMTLFNRISMDYLLIDKWIFFSYNESLLVDCESLSSFIILYVRTIRVGTTNFCLNFMLYYTFVKWIKIGSLTTINTLLLHTLSAFLYF